MLDRSVKQNIIEAFTIWVATMENTPHLFDENRVSIESLTILLRKYRFRFVTEKDLQDGIAAALDEAGILYSREKSLGKPDRPDFIVGTVAIEVKIKGSLADLLRQVSRYASHDEISAVLAVGTPHWLTRVPPTLVGKQVQSLRLLGSLL